jgi:DNA polymerase-4
MESFQHLLKCTGSVKQATVKSDSSFSTSSLLLPAGGLARPWYNPAMSFVRSILHLDMDAFFAAVEQRDKPELRGKPVLIGHDGPRGVVATASYEARPFGCHSAQPMVTAKRLCPHAIVLPVRGERYQEVSEQMFAIMEEFSPAIEPLSIDEAFLDLTGTERLLGRPEDAAGRLRQRIKSELDLTASVGVSFNKFLAKLGSDMHKPDGLTIIRPEDVDSILPPLPVTKLFGIGKATGARLAKIGIKTVGDLRHQPIEWLQQQLGSEAQWYLNLAHGIDDRPVTPDREAKSIGHEQTFEVDVADADEVRRVLFVQVEQVARRLRKHGLRARGIALKIRFGDFETISRSATLAGPTDVTMELWSAARGLFDKWPFRPVRLIGMTAERLTAGGNPMTLFPDPEKERQKKLDSVTDRINAKYGNRTIKRGGAG